MVLSLPCQVSRPARCGLTDLLSWLSVLRNFVMVLRPKLSWLLPLDENRFFHRQIAYSILFFSIIHTTAHCVQRSLLLWRIH